MNPNQYTRSAGFLRERFVEGLLLDPRGGDGNTVDLIRAVARRCGVSGIVSSDRVGAMESVLGTPDHVVFVLLDGLGMNVLERLDPDGFFRSSEFRELRALAPSTTSCVVTALATAAYPTEHCISGWFTYLPERGQTAVPLPFVDRFSGKSLADSGIAVEELFPVPSVLPRMSVATCALLPEAYWDSPYARYWRGGTRGEGYREIPEAADRVLAGMRRESASFSYLYLPHIDEVSHHFGPDSEEALAAARVAEKEMARLARKLPGNARLIMTADHGQVHVAREANRLLFDGDAMLALLEAPPSGEGRFPLFHVKPECRDAFRELFQERYAPEFLLLTIDEIESMRLYGPEPLSPVARRRFGDYAAIPLGPWTLNYSPPEKDPADAHLGRHGGLSPEEMRVPLLLR